MDGTLTDTSFTDSVWLDGVSRKYAVKNGVSPKIAKRKVMSEYLKVGRERLEWYDLAYWVKRLDLDVSPEEILSSYRHRIKSYPEVHDVLREFRKDGFRLVILTNAHREFADLQLQETRLTPYFERVFSSTSDFGLVKNTVRPYRKMCRICNIGPEGLIHVGDDERFDFDVPRRLGIAAYHLERSSKKSGEFVIHNLKELIEKVDGHV
jgi:HAD superfamily hydrolase (TIGR01549 family)